MADRPSVARIAVFAAVALACWQFSSSEAVRTLVPRLKVLRAVVPSDAPPRSTAYLAGVLGGLGLAPHHSPPLDRSLLDNAVRRAAGKGDSDSRLFAAYALLAAPPDVRLADRLLSAVPARRSDAALVALWVGRAAWARGETRLALRAWETAFGDTYDRRKLLASALYVVGDMPLSFEAAVGLWYTADVDARRRADIIEMMKNWMQWRVGTDEQALALCTTALSPTWRGRSEHLADPLMADILARQAIAEHALGRDTDADRSMAQAEGRSGAPYVKAARAYLLFVRGDRAAARTAALHVARAVVNDGHALLLCIHVLREVGETAAALDVWRQIADRAPLLASTVQDPTGVTESQQRQSPQPDGPRPK